MAQAAHDQVVEITDYLRDTIRDIDNVIREWARKRQQLATRLGVLEASNDPDVLAAAADFDERIEEGRRYEDARDVSEVVAEAHRRYVG